MADDLDSFKDKIVDFIEELFGVDEHPAEGGQAGETLNRDKQTVVKIVGDLEKGQGINIQEDDIISEAKIKEIDEDTAEAIITELLKDGYIFRPRFTHGIVRMHGDTDFSPAAEHFPS